jgi:hypothetical protein
VRLAYQLAAVVEIRLGDQYDAGMQPAPIHPVSLRTGHALTPPVSWLAR